MQHGTMTTIIYSLIPSDDFRRPDQRNSGDPERCRDYCEDQHGFNDREPGDAADLIKKVFDSGLAVEGLSFHVGSQCTNFENYVQALQLSANIIKEAEERTGRGY